MTSKKRQRCGKKVIDIELNGLTGKEYEERTINVAKYIVDEGRG